MIAVLTRPPTKPPIIPRRPPVSEAISTGTTPISNDTRPAVEDPRQHVAAQLVGAEQMVAPTERLQPPDDAFLVGVERRDPWRAERRQHDQQHRRAEYQCRGIAPQAVCHPTASNRVPGSPEPACSSKASSGE